jgi:hypothetical protein
MAERDLQAPLGRVSSTIQHSHQQWTTFHKQLTTLANQNEGSGAGVDDEKLAAVLERAMPQSLMAQAKVNLLVAYSMATLTYSA